MLVNILAIAFKLTVCMLSIFAQAFYILYNYFLLLFEENFSLIFYYGP